MLTRLIYYNESDSTGFFSPSVTLGLCDKQPQVSFAVPSPQLQSLMGEWVRALTWSILRRTAHSLQLTGMPGAQVVSLIYRVRGQRFVKLRGCELKYSDSFLLVLNSFHFQFIIIHLNQLILIHGTYSTYRVICYLLPKQMNWCVLVISVCPSMITLTYLLVHFSFSFWMTW